MKPSPKPFNPHPESWDEVAIPERRPEPEQQQLGLFGAEPPPAPKQRKRGGR